MDPFLLPPLAALLDAASDALSLLTDLLTPLVGETAAAASVIVVTLLVRIALIPVGISQARAEQTRARLVPRVRTLQKRHRNDRDRLQREIMRLYADERASPAAGCVPLLIQAPIVGIIYALFLRTSIAEHANPLLADELFGVPLGTTAVHLLSAGALDPMSACVFAGLVAGVALVAELSRRLLRTPTSDAAAAAARLTLVAEFLPFLTAFAVLVVPLAAGLYLVVTVAWTLVQRLLLRRRYPLPPAV